VRDPEQVASEGVVSLAQARQTAEGAEEGVLGGVRGEKPVMLR